MDNNPGRVEGAEEAGGKRKKRNMGRNEWSRQNLDKRARNDEINARKKQKIEQGEEIDTPIYATNFSQEDIENEQRRPKKKAAVLLGYSGTGYHGMQLSAEHKTIEGELFPALVAAGAISKANASDPKKSSFVRCARTDKGVHASGNVISLKMIVEDEDIVQKINSHLSPQIRVWGIELASKSFSCYHMCDSRVYEFLIPSHCFLPPHHSTYLGKKIVEIAEKEGDLEKYKERQAEVEGFWEGVDEKYIKPILEGVPEDIRTVVEKALHINEKAEDKQEPQDSPESATSPTEPQPQEPEEKKPQLTEAEESRRREAIAITKAVKAAYLRAKRAYRIPESRLDRIQAALDQYVGTKNFFNYTIQKQHKDPSAKRYIKSFNLNRKPIIINDTEWLSLKVHGQSFMMHQIRKMVAMAAMVVRCGADPERMRESYENTKIAIPKAPGLGLLLERPVFDSYNKKAADLGRGAIDFSKHEAEISEFKQREIYDRIFREEEETNAFSSFFNHIDHFSQEEFLYVTSGGIAAAKPSLQSNASGDAQAEGNKTGRISQIGRAHV